jgi:hypothetical protein
LHSLPVEVDGFRAVVAAASRRRFRRQFFEGRRLPANRHHA